MEFSDWAHVALLIVVVVFSFILGWAFRRVREILSWIDAREQARAMLKLESFAASDVDFVEKFNRNFRRLELAIGGKSPVLEEDEKTKEESCS